MTEPVNVERLKEHSNAFGFLRLLFAALVIVSHTPVMVDGNDAREPLTWLGGSITFGELAVDGFFLISGYLIVGSFVKRPKIWPYLLRRIARIYPAFIVASLICLLIVAPLGGTRLAIIIKFWLFSVENMIQLQMPLVLVFDGTFYPQLNSSMWTIKYEFLCYLLVIPLGIAGFFKKPVTIAILSIGLLFLFVIIQYNNQLDAGHPSNIIDYIPHPANKIIELTGIFFTGSLFYLYRSKIPFTKIGIIVAAVGLCIALYVPILTSFAVATLGAYLIFATAAWGGAGVLSRINNRDDISYGVYLYAWPAEKLMFWYWPNMPLLLAGIATLIVACLCGWISWHGLEKPAMALFIGKRAGPA